MEKLWKMMKTYGKPQWKIMKTYGKPMENDEDLRKTNGK